MSRRAFVSAVGSALFALSGCGAVQDLASGASAAPTAVPTLSPNGVAVQFGENVRVGRTFADLFDTTNARLAQRIALPIAVQRTRVGPVVTSFDRRHLYVTGYDPVDPGRVHASLFDVDLTRATARRVADLGRGIPIDATLDRGRYLDVLVADPSTNDPVRGTHVVTLDVVSHVRRTFQNPLPPGPDGTVPLPLAIVADPLRPLVYLTDRGGTVFALAHTTMGFRTIVALAQPNFTAGARSTAIDASHSVLYQTGLLSETGRDGVAHTSGAMLSTSLFDGQKRVLAFPYTPIPGHVVDPPGTSLYFISFYDRANGIPFLTRVDLVGRRIVAQPISTDDGVPETLTSTSALALSSDGAHVLVPVSTTGGGAMLEFDPATLALQSKVPADDDFSSGGVVAR